jgi:hypothetical protein
MIINNKNVIHLFLIIILAFGCFFIGYMTRDSITKRNDCVKYEDFGVDYSGFYSKADKFFCIWTENLSQAYIIDTEKHEYCHYLVQEDKNHFC